MAARRNFPIAFDLRQVCQTRDIATNFLFVFPPIRKKKRRKESSAGRTNLFLPTHVAGPSYPPAFRIAASTSIVRRRVSGIENYRRDCSRIAEKFRRRSRTCRRWGGHVVGSRLFPLPAPFFFFFFIKNVRRFGPPTVKEVVVRNLSLSGSRPW